MMASPQNTFRNSLLSQVLAELQSGRLNHAEAFVAVIGCAAAIAATLPPASRQSMIEQADGHMLARANAIAADIKSGKFDRDVAGH
jgi:hypothetical protein